MTNKMPASALRGTLEKIKQSKLIGAEVLKIPELGALEITVVGNFSDFSAVHTAVLDFQAKEGWLCLQSEVRHFQNGNLDYAEDEILLYGEFAKP